MAKLKKGSQTGKCDAHFEGIKVGDRLSDPEGNVARVDEYGSLLIVGGEKLGPKEWDGAAWTLMGDVEEQIAASAQRAAALDDFPEDRTDVSEMFDVSEVEDLESLEETTEPVTDADLILELKRRGYSGTLRHTYTVTENVEI